MREHESTNPVSFAQMEWALALEISNSLEVFVDRVALQAEEKSLPLEICERIEAAFARGSMAGLLHLGLVEVQTELPPALAYFRDISRQFASSFAELPDLEAQRTLMQVPLPSSLQMKEWLDAAPPFAGSELLSTDLFGQMWTGLLQGLVEELRVYPGSVQAYLAEKHPLWGTLGRLCFHLAENKRDLQKPFAFLATYASQVQQGALQHLPLKHALHAFQGQPAVLRKWLLPLQKATEHAPFLRELLESKQVFHPLAWTPKQAYRFLREIPHYEDQGIAVRVPNWWQTRRTPKVQVKIGDKVSLLGADALMDFSVTVTLDGQSLTEEEWEALLASSDGLIQVKGQWIEADTAKLQEVLAHWKGIQSAASREGVSFLESLRLLAGVSVGKEEDVPEDVRAWSHVAAGEQLETWLQQMRQPEQLEAVEAVLKTHLQAELRPYQQVGVRWLWFVTQLRLGGCLADDMGLGKTIQVIALLLLRKPQRQGTPDVLVVPASLLGNWQREIERFAPSLCWKIAHPSGGATAVDLEHVQAQDLRDVDVILTTYGSVLRSKTLQDMCWGLVVLDEAQAIKNPTAKQTKAIKGLHSQVRLALTGTPVENNLGDLWSLFDFVCPGLLGTAPAFRQFVKSLSTKQKPGIVTYAPLRNLVRPYLLRRVKTDKRVIADLPDKTEIQSFCTLSKTQAALYQRVVDELTRQLELVEGMNRRGVVLTALLRLKQVCNHPTQWAGHGEYTPAASGKFLRLAELIEEIHARHEKVLLFTQYRELCDPLAAYLQGLFGRPGLVLHGQTKIAERQPLVEAFQEPKGPPFFVLSLKAGGMGLNLTAAAHVIHFDRWWNPAVENQATDRAYRIGQKKNVLVHKFVCRGTLEEKIDALIASKQSLSKEILSESGEFAVTELSNQELLQLVRLDVHQVDIEAE